MGSTLIFLLLAILGIGATIYYGIQQRNKDSEILMFPIAVFNPFHSIVEHFESVNIDHIDQPIGSEILYIGFGVINIGDLDIVKSSSPNSIYMTLPESFQWIDVKITNQSQGLEIKSTIDENLLKIDFDLFKCGESFRIRSLVKNQDENQQKPTLQYLVDKIRFHHRIPHLKPVQINNLLEKRRVIHYEVHGRIYKQFGIGLAIIPILYIIATFLFEFDGIIMKESKGEDRFVAFMFSSIGIWMYILGIYMFRKVERIMKYMKQLGTPLKFFNRF